VAVNVGDSVDVVKKIQQELESPVPCLLDTDGSRFSEIASEKLPRTYVLDAEGKILWFDVEYSRGMRRELRNAIFFHLHGASEPLPAKTL
jgi:hypothetical protein